MRCRLLLVLCATFALLAASCGGGDQPTDDTSGDGTRTSNADGEVTAGADADSDGSTTTTTEAPLAPPTTRGPAPILDVEPVTSIGAVTIIDGEPAYRGLLGQLDPQRNIVQAVALPPADAAPGIAPLTGLPLRDPSIAQRPAIVAKIDNLLRAGDFDQALYFCEDTLAGNPNCQAARASRRARRRRSRWSSSPPRTCPRCTASQTPTPAPPWPRP